MLVQVVLLYDLDTWVMTPHMVRALGIFQNRMAHHLTVRKLQRLRDRSSEYPPIDAGGNVGGGFGVGGGVCLEEEEYGHSVLLIMDLCEELVQRPGAWVY